MLIISHRISIHAAREGGDALAPSRCTKKATFQSTPPVKAATQLIDSVKHLINISIHAAREGGDEGRTPTEILCMISIHAAREGGDASCPIGYTGRRDFNPRRP